MKAGFNDLIGCLRQVLAGLPDRRKGKNLSYAMEDFGLSAFSVFFTQSPSFLAHQKAMQAARGHNNAQSFFQIEEIPQRQSDSPNARPGAAPDALSGV